MSSSRIKLPPGQRHQLVRATLRRVVDKRRTKDDKEDEDGQPTDFEAGVFLAYKDPTQEDSFLQFIHSGPLFVELLLQVTLFLAFAIQLAIYRSAWFAIYTPILFILMSIEIYVHVSGRHREGRPLFEILKIERALMVIPGVLGVMATIYNNYRILHDCSDLHWTPVGSQPRAHTEGYCNYMTSFPAVGLGLVAVLQVIRFRVMVVASSVVVVFSALIWLAPSRLPREDAAWSVVRLTAFLFSGLAFVCFIRYVDEKQQRRHFDAQEKLIRSAEALGAKRVATLERFLAVLPLTVSRRLRDGQWQSSQVDVASDATVLVTRIHDFPTWSTSMLPLQVAALVASMQTELDTLLRAGRLERVGRLGDTTVAVRNLLERSEGNAAAVTIETARKLVTLRSDIHARLPTLLTAVHMGSVEGVLQGAHYVRYEVRGPAVEATRSGVQLCGSSGRLLGSTAIMAAAADDDGDWFKDFESLEVETSGGESVTFRRLDPQRRRAASHGSSATQDSALSATAVVLGGDDGRFVSGVSRLLGQQSTTDTMASSSVTTMLQQSATGTDDPINAPTQKTEPLEIVMDRLGFYRFADDDADKLFRKKRLKTLPQEAAKVWLGYAAFVFVVLIILLTELEGPHAIVGAILLVLAIVGSACLALVPSMAGDERMDAVNVPWTVVGMFVPLLTVFGCALSRPSAVGLDVRVYTSFGAFMRSYCFNDARLQAIGVPGFALIATLQYLVPGAHESVGDIPITWILILATVVAARNREGSELKNYRRVVTAEAVVQQIEEVTRVQQGLLRSSLPRSVFEAAVAADFRGPRQVHQALAVVMVIRAVAPSRPAGSTSGRIVGGLGRVLDQVASTTYLSTAGVLGDDALVVGPVPTTSGEADVSSAVAEQSLHEALTLGMTITEPGGDVHALSVLVDQDTAAHVVELGAQPNYSLLGISATRMISIGADVSGMVRGLLVTDRVTAMVKASAMLDDVVVEVQAPMSVRGQGVLRWNRIRKP